MSSFIYFGYQPQLDIFLVDIFSHSIGYQFVLLMVSRVETVIWCSPPTCMFLLLFSLLLVSDLQNHCHVMSRGLLPMFSFGNSAVSGLTFFNPFWVSFWVWCNMFPNTAYWRYCPFLIVYFGFFVINWQYTCWSTSGLSLLVIYVSVFMSVPYCFDYYSFVISFDVGKHDASSSFLSQGCFGCSRSFMIPHRSQDYFYEKCHWNFNSNCIESVHWFGQYGYFNINSSNPWAQIFFPFICLLWFLSLIS